MTSPFASVTSRRCTGPRLGRDRAIGSPSYLESCTGTEHSARCRELTFARLQPATVLA